MGGRDKPDHDGKMETVMKHAVCIKNTGCLALLGLAALALSGCISVEEARAQRDAFDDAECRNFGARPGTDAYVRCRTDLQRNRAIESEARRPVVVTSVWGDPFFGPSFVSPHPYCRPTPFGLRCY